MKTKILLTFLCLFLYQSSSHAAAIEDVIADRKLNINIEKDRCDLAWIIFHDHIDIFNSNQVEHYDVVVGNDFNHKTNDIFWSVNKEGNKKIATFYDTDSFYILKLKNGRMISDKNGYFVPFEEFKIGFKNYQTKGDLVILQKDPPKDKIKYFSVQNCEVKILNKE